MTTDKIEITIDGNCGNLPAPRNVKAPTAEEQDAIDMIKAGDVTGWELFESVVVAFSGGKDSLAAVLQLLELGCPREKLELWHHEIDGRESVSAFMDWPITPDYCQRVADALELPLRYSWKQHGFRGEMLRNDRPTAPTSFECGDGETRTTGGKGKNGTRMKFPAVSADLQARWCSSYLKIDVAATAYRNDPRFKQGGRFMMITGERREESANRAKYAETERHKSSNSKRTVIQWRSVIDWTEAEVWEIIERHGVTPHPCYRAGFGRCSCAFCIFGSPNQMAAAADLLPEQFDELVKVENEIGYTMHSRKVKRQTVGVDLLEYVARGESFAADAPAEVREACGSREYTGPVLTDSWQLPAGAFGESNGPS